MTQNHLGDIAVLALALMLILWELGRPAREERSRRRRRSVNRERVARYEALLANMRERGKLADSIIPHHHKHATNRGKDHG